MFIAMLIIAGLMWWLFGKGHSDAGRITEREAIARYLDAQARDEVGEGAQALTRAAQAIRESAHQQRASGADPVAPFTLDPAGRDTFKVVLGGKTIGFVIPSGKGRGYDAYTLAGAKTGSAARADDAARALL